VLSITSLQLASRNLLRNRVRSVISLSAIVFGIVALLLSGGFIEWIFFDMRETTIRSRLGHLQITRPGFLSRGAADPFAFLLPGNPQEFEIISTRPHIRLVTPRISFAGLISRGEATISFLAEGVEPEKEALVSEQLKISQGQNLSSQDSKGIIVGEGLAANLDIKLGDRVVLLGTTETGGVSALEGHVRGLFYTTSKAFDDTFLRVPIATARELLRVAGSHTWVVLLDKTEDTEPVLNQLKRQFSASKIHLEVTPWTTQADFYRNTVKLFSRQFGILKFIIGVIIVLSISNMMTMSILERTGEIGTLMALGSKRRKILQMFITEGLLLGLTGGVVGLILGMVLAQIISAVGIPMPPAPGMTRGFTGQILVTPGLAFSAFLISGFTSTLASLYPSWKASRLQIVDALRHNR
jgi:putative ABC transport system permease protein